VFIESGRTPEEAAAEVAFAERIPSVRGIVGAVTFDRLGPQLDALAFCWKLKGVRCNLQESEDNFLTLQMFQAMDLLTRRNLSFDLCVRSDQLPDVFRLAISCPRTQFILDHCGKPRPNELGGWSQSIAALSPLRNLACKLSGLTTQCLDPEEMSFCLAHVLKHLGPQRVMFGSDFPLVSSWKDWMDTVQHAMDEAGWSVADQQRVWSENAQRIYRLPASAL
jgi:L-fuconolactonase